MSRLLAHAMLFATLALGGMSPQVAHAEESAKRVAPAAKVTLTMPVVYATESHKRIDPKLESVARYLKHLRYTGFELLDTQRVQLSARGKESFNIAGGRKVIVELLSRDARRAQVRVQVRGSKDRKLMDTTLWVNRNGTFIVAGPRHKEGILVLPLTARY